MNHPRAYGRAALSGALLLLVVSSGQTQLSLTPAGVGLGLTLSTFATGFPNQFSVGPLGIGFVSNGNVLVSDYPGNVRVFATDTDNQTAGSAPIGQNYGAANAVDIRQVGQKFYMTRQGVGDVIQINADGTFNQLIVGGMPAATGMTVNPNNGHLLVSTLGNNVIWDVDPIAKTKVSLVNASADGLTATSTTLYAEVGGAINFYDITSGAFLGTTGGVAGAPDGVAVGTGLFSGLLFINTNGGTLVQYNLNTTVSTVIANGGSRGDFMTVDMNDGSLLITQTDRIMRLRAPQGGGFGGVPEPGSVAMLGGMVVAGGLAIRRKR